MHQILIFVYQGAEVVRMYKTLLGSQGFRKVETRICLSPKLRILENLL
jgi:hypothetical protein